MPGCCLIAVDWRSIFHFILSMYYHTQKTSFIILIYQKKIPGDIMYYFPLIVALMNQVSAAAKVFDISKSPHCYRSMFSFNFALCIDYVIVFVCLPVIENWVEVDFEQNMHQRSCHCCCFGLCFLASVLSSHQKPSFVDNERAKLMLCFLILSLHHRPNTLNKAI